MCARKDLHFFFNVFLFLVGDIITVAKNNSLVMGFLSLDQQKAFDRMDHNYFIKTPEVFGFGPLLISLIKLL